MSEPTTIKEPIEKHTALSDLPGIRFAEIQKLEARDIHSVEELYSNLEQDPVNAIKELSKDTGIPIERFIAWLAPSVLVKTSDRNETFSQKHWSGIQLLWFPVLALVLLFINAMIPVGSRQVVFARRALSAGTALDRKMVYSATLKIDGDFLAWSEMQGDLRLASDVLRDQPLRAADLDRLQLVAARDLEPGSLLEPDDLKPARTHFSPRAIIDTSEALGKRIAVSRTAGETLLAGDLRDGPALSQVVSAARDLLPLQTLGANDLAITRVENAGSAASSPDTLIGGLLLQAVQSGELIPQDGFVPAPELKDKVVVTLPLGEAAPNPLALPGNKVTLELKPADPSLEQLQLAGVQILAQDNRSLTVLVSPEDAARLTPLLGQAQLIILTSP